MASPAFAIVGRSQQAVHLFFVSPRTRVLQEGIDLVDRRRQADEIQAQAPQQSGLAGDGGRLQLLLFELGQNKTVDRGASPGDVLHRGKWGADRGHKGPVFFDTGGGGAGRIGPRSALLNPALQRVDLFGRQRLTAHRHARLLADAGDALVKRTGAGLARQDHLAGLPAGQCQRFRVQPQTGLLSLFAVAAITALHENGLDIADEVDGLAENGGQA